MQKELREQYIKKFGKPPFGGWTDEQVVEKLRNAAEQDAPPSPAEPEKPAFVTHYKELPPPIVKHLEDTWGNWLNYFEIGQEWKQSFGGYGAYVKVPEKFSTEWRREKRMVYDNNTRAVKRDPSGNEVTQEIVMEDIRWKPIKDTGSVIKWFDLVKDHIISKAHQRGIKLPNTQTDYKEDHITREDYTRRLHN